VLGGVWGEDELDFIACGAFICFDLGEVISWRCLVMMEARAWAYYMSSNSRYCYRVGQRSS